MFRAVNRPAVSYDLVGLASFGLVTVGRESEAALRLDCTEIPYLLSRKHVTLQLQPNGKILLKDLGSTNGTYTARPGMPLRKLAPEVRWELEEGDTISFGGPEVIMARGEHVPNPFVFKFYLCFNDLEAETGRNPTADDLQSDQGGAASSVPNQSASAQGAYESAASRIPSRDFRPVDLTRSDSPDENGSDQQAESSEVGSGTHHAQEPVRPEQIKSTLDQNQDTQQHQRSLTIHHTRQPHSSSNVMTSILATHLSCPICHDWLVACHTLTCGHMFCGLCLATWLDQNQSCPSCRKAVAGVPVRCFQVDSTINDLLDQGINVMSPPTKNERRQKQDHWEHVQGSVVPDWALSLHNRKQKAADSAARHNRGYMARAVPIGSSHRLSEHGSGPSRRV